MSERTFPNWYAVYTASRAEKKVSERLTQAGIEHYLPLQTVIRVWSDRRKKVEVPVISGYLFVHIPESEIARVRTVPGVAFFLREFGHPAVIPDVQIETLRFMVGNAEEPVEFTPEQFVPGDAVRVTRGQLAGMVGELVQLQGKYKVALRIASFGCALVNVPIGSLEKL